MKIKVFFKKYILRFPVLDILILGAVLAFDLISKYFAEKSNVDMNVLGRLLRFEYHENTGAAFSFLAGKEWARTFFIVTSSIIIPAMFVFAFFSRKGGFVSRISLALIISGALGNFIDRVFLAYVRDFISVSFFPPVFNIADSSLTIGVVMFLIYFIFIYKEPEKKKKEVALQGGDSGAVQSSNSSEAKTDEVGKDFAEKGINLRLKSKESKSSEKENKASKSDEKEKSIDENK